MPAIDDPFSLAASLPGQLAEMRRQIKDLSSNNTQAGSQALVAATASAASATTASNAATSSAAAATTASNAATTSAGAATTASNAATNAMVSPAVLSTSAGAYTTTTTFGVISSLSFSVPAGYTRALITAQSVCNINSSAATSEIGYSKVAIAGVDGMVTSGQWPTATALGMLPANSAANLTGLAGGTVTVTLSVRVQYGPASGGFASLNATALFLR